MNEFMDYSTIADDATQIVTLDKLQFNQKALVNRVKSESTEVQCRLLTLGLYPGVHIEILRKAPMGDPLQIRAGTTLMSIRRHEAEGIEVELDT